jgi:hypothetical protein
MITREVLGSSKVVLDLSGNCLAKLSLEYVSNIDETLNFGQNKAQLCYGSKHNLSATCQCLYSRKYFNCKHMQIARFNATDMIGNAMNLLEKKIRNLLI